MPDWTAINKLAQRDVSGEKLDPIEIALLKLYWIDDPECEVVAAEGATEYAEQREILLRLRDFLPSVTFKY